MFQDTGFNCVRTNCRIVPFFFFSIIFFILHSLLLKIRNYNNKNIKIKNESTSCLE